MAKRTSPDRPTRGVFIVWDTEQVDVERQHAGTILDRTVVTARRVVPVEALWSNDVTDKAVAAADQYTKTIADQYDNVRVRVYTGQPGSVRA